jgi:hypothetical protein
MQSDICKILGLNIDKCAYEAVRDEFGLQSSLYDYDSPWYKEVFLEDC